MRIVALDCRRFRMMRYMDECVQYERCAKIRAPCRRPVWSASPRRVPARVSAPDQPSRRVARLSQRNAYLERGLTLQEQQITRSLKEIVMLKQRLEKR